MLTALMNEDTQLYYKLKRGNLCLKPNMLLHTAPGRSAHCGLFAIALFLP